MYKFIRFISNVKWIGLIGIFGNMIYPSRTLRLLGLVIMLGLIELFYDFPLVLQSLKQIMSIPFTYIRYGWRLPSKGNYHCKVEYRLPFEGEWAVVNGGVDKVLSHSWSILAQRYAYDFLVLDQEGHSFHGEPNNPDNYYCYGKKIVAPADGIVIQVHNKLPDSRIYGNGMVDNHVKDIRGNFIIIKHAEKEYSFIAHIKPNSILVKEGQKVLQGDEIGSCGNSGNSSEPHVHFHIQDGKSVFASAGLPISFQNTVINIKENYKRYDPRKLPANTEKAGISEGYIHRGQMVETIN